MTSTPLHALTTLNDPTWVEAARALAEQTMVQHSELSLQLEAAYRAVLCRAPNERELKILESSSQNSVRCSKLRQIQLLSFCRLEANQFPHQQIPFRKQRCRSYVLGS